jgi:NAD+ diphosphatase
MDHTVFTGNPLDRVSAKRPDSAWIAARLADPNARVLAVWNGRPFVETPGDEGREEGARLAYITAGEARRIAGDREDGLFFLGLDGETPVFGMEIGGASDPGEGAFERRTGRFAELRGVALALPPSEAAVVATAKSLLDWHRRHGFCSACGNASRSVDSGWRRVCPACETEHFPRVDPVVIMLAVANDKCLLGRNAGWPEGRMSALAGFMEPGETIEEACARELKEESGLVVRSVAYHSSQPWPFPSSLMIGLIAEVEDGQAVPDGVEILELRWFARDEARDVLAGRHPEVATPGGLGIARTLFASWCAG